MRALTLSLLIFFSAVREAKIFSRCEFASILKLNTLEGYAGIHMDDCELAFLFPLLIPFAEGTDSGSGGFCISRSRNSALHLRRQCAPLLLPRDFFLKKTVLFKERKLLLLLLLAQQ